MGKFKDFYQKLQEDKILKLKEGQKNVLGDLTDPKKAKKTETGLLKKVEEDSSSDIVKNVQPKDGDGFIQSPQSKEEKGEIPVVAKPVFKKIQKRKDIPEEPMLDEKLSYTTGLLSQYPNSPIDLSQHRLIRNPESKSISQTFGYDVTISPKNNLFSFIRDYPITFQMNDEGIMKFETKWDEKAIEKHVRNSLPKGERDSFEKRLKLITYVHGLPKSQRESAEEFLKYFNDYKLYWKFQNAIDSLKKTNPPDEEVQIQRIQDKIDGLTKKPEESEDNFENYANSQEFSDTIEKMGEYTIADAIFTRKVLKELDVQRITYFYPTLIDVIRMYDEGETTHRKLPTKALDMIDTRDQNVEQVNETLYTDVASSTHNHVPFKVDKPNRYDYYTKKLGGNLGNIVFEYFSPESRDTHEPAGYNRITDKAVLIGYRNDRYTSIDIQTSYPVNYAQLVKTVARGRNFTVGDHDFIPVYLLKTGLQNVVDEFNGQKVCALDGEGSLQQRQGTRRFL